MNTTVINFIQKLLNIRDFFHYQLSQYSKSIYWWSRDTNFIHSLLVLVLQGNRINGNHVYNYASGCVMWAYRTGGGGSSSCSDQDGHCRTRGIKDAAPIPGKGRNFTGQSQMSLCWNPEETQAHIRRQWQQRKQVVFFLSFIPPRLKAYWLIPPSRRVFPSQFAGPQVNHPSTQSCALLIC